MKKGIYRTVKINNTNIRIIVTNEFIKRIKGRHINIPLADAKIDEAIPEIHNIWTAIKHQFPGIIESRKSKINIVFKIVPAGTSLNMVLITVMAKPDFISASTRDYVIHVNPAIRIVFEQVVDSPLAGIIKDDIITRRKKLKSGYCYHIEDVLIDYYVECGENFFAIPCANWQKLYLISVS